MNFFFQCEVILGPEFGPVQAPEPGNTLSRADGLGMPRVAVSASVMMVAALTQKSSTCTPPARDTQGLAHPHRSRHAHSTKPTPVPQTHSDMLCTDTHNDSTHTQIPGHTCTLSQTRYRPPRSTLRHSLPHDDTSISVKWQDSRTRVVL